MYRLTMIHPLLPTINLMVHNYFRITELLIHIDNTVPTEINKFTFEVNLKKFTKGMDYTTTKLSTDSYIISFFIFFL